MWFCLWRWAVPSRQAWALGGAGFVLRCELPVQTLKHAVGTVIGPQPQNPATRMFDHAPGFEHDLLHHRLHAPPLGRMAQWRVFANERILANQAQDVHRHRSQSADQEVGVEFATGQALQIHVGLELGMELLVRGMVFVQIDDVLHRELVRQCCRPALQFVGGQQQRVAVLVDVGGVNQKSSRCSEPPVERQFSRS